MSLTLVTAPTDEPLTTAEAREHCRLEDDTIENAALDAYVAAARSSVEVFLKQSLLATRWQLTLDCFPAGIRLPIGPVLAATGNVVITYVDDAGATQTLATSAYKVSYGETCRIRPAYGLTWPSTRSEMDAVTILFTAGAASAADLPKAVVQAVKLTLGHYFENREATVVGTGAVELPLGARNLLIPFVRHD